MSRIIRYLSPFLAVFVGRPAFVYFLSGTPDGASASESAGGFGHAQFALRFGADFPARAVGLFAAGTLLYAVILGYVASAAMGDRGFGPRLNGLVALMGSWAALALYLGFFAHGAPESLEAIVVVIFGSLAAILAAVAAKAMPGRQPKVSAAYQRVLDPPPPGPSAGRMRAAVSREKR